MLIGSILKCKICGKEISPPEIIVGEAPVARDARIFSRLYKHLEKRAEAESKVQAGPHLAAIAMAAQNASITSANLNGAMLTGHFELPPDLEKQREACLRQVHEMTRTVRFSDDDLKARIEADGIAGLTILRYLQDLRDEYESLGIHAPKPQEIDMVKQ